MKYLLLLVSVFIGGAAVGSLAEIHFNDSCSQLVKIEQDRDAKQAAAEQQAKDFWSNKGKPIPFPKFEEHGF